MANLKPQVILRRVTKSDLHEVVNIYQCATRTVFHEGIAKAVLKHSNLEDISTPTAAAFFRKGWRHIGTFLTYRILPRVASYGLVKFLPCKDLKSADTYFSRNKHAMFIAEMDGIVVGTAGIRVPNLKRSGKFKGLRKEGDAELVRMYVLPSHQGHGIGRQLMEATIQFARDEGFKRIVLTSSTLQHVATAVVYPKYGFVKEKDFHIVMGIRPMFMSKEL